MCGIAGYFGSLKLAPSSKNINNCLKLMKRRGPDHQNFNIQNFKDRRMITLHSRLSIIDPNKISNQPMEDDTGIIAFNGEIYNYLELKKQLNLKNLKTNSDTEVLMKYLKIKKNVPDDDLDGMWAYSYFDKNSKKLFLSRDRFGEKPLYYKIEKDAFYYGSDINYIIALSNQKKIFDETKIYSFISLGFKSLFLNDNTFIKNIKVFPPSHVMQIDFQNNKKLFRYWNYKKKKELTKNYTYKEAKNITKNLIKTEFKKRYRSDFKISCLLSGGIDSTAIAACSYNNKTSLDFFSINSQNSNYNERPRINKFCGKYKSKSNFVKMNQLNNYFFLEKIIKETNFPLSSISYLVYAHLNKVINKKGLRVILTGLGGDEIFGGYYTHQMNYLVSKIKDKKFVEYYNNWDQHVRPLVRSKVLSNLDEYIKLSKSKFSSFHEKSEVDQFINNKKKKNIVVRNNKFFKNFFRNGLAVDMFRDTLPPQLLSSDQISMFFSIENRAPFLSHKIYNFINSLPDEYLIKDGYGKSILRDSLKGLVPKEILKFREKIGFYADLDSFFDRKNIKFRDMLFQSKLINSFLKIKNISDLLKKEKLNNAESKFIFCILNLAILSSK